MFYYRLSVVLALLAASCGGGGSLGQSGVAGGSIPGSGSLPLGFEPNQGQAGPGVQFLGRSRGYNLYLTGQDMVFDVTVSAPGGNEAPLVAPDNLEPSSGSSVAVSITLVGASKAPSSWGLDKLPGVVNYYIGNDPSKWLTGVATYGRVGYQDVYPGIGMIFYGSPQGVVEHDFLVSPGADPSQIRMKVNGAKAISLKDTGDLDILITDGTDLIMKKPMVYQDIGSSRVIVGGEYQISGDGIISFSLGKYDTTQELVIDPVTLGYSTFLGGSADDLTWGIALDSSQTGCTTAGSPCPVIVGYSKSTSFAGGTNNNSGIGGSQVFDVYVIKLGSDGASKTWETFIGGTNGNSLANSVQVDSTGVVYLAGYTTATNFTTTSASSTASAAFTTTNQGDYDGFVTKLSPAGALSDATTKPLSSYFGGNNFDRIVQVALDTTSTGCTTASFACMVIVGTTTSTSFPTTGGSVEPFLPTGAVANAFVGWITTSGTPAIGACTYNGGGASAGSGNGGVGRRDIGTGVVVDSGAPANVYVTGETRSGDFPTTASVVKTSLGGTQDAFVTKLPGGSGGLGSRTYSTYLGGTGVDRSGGIALFSGSAYVTGSTTALDFTGGSSATTLGAGGGLDIYVAKLNSGATALTYLTYIGGTGSDQVLGFQSIAVDSIGRAWVTGQTASSGFPMTGTNSAIATTGSGTGGQNSYPSQSTFPATGGGSSAFVLRMDAVDVGTALSLSTFLGGSTSGKNDIGLGIALDSSGTRAYITGIVASSDFPQTTSGVQNGNAGGLDGFNSKISLPSSGCPAAALTDCTSGYEVGALEILVLKPSSASANGINPTQSISLPSGYNLAAGGAKVTQVSGGGVNFITEITPNAASATSWVTQSFSNSNGEQETANINAYAIVIRYKGVALTSTTNTCTLIGSPTTDYVVCSATASSAAAPSASATLPTGYTLIGGGGGTGDGTEGNYLTASYPDPSLNARTWTVKGKDHAVSDPATATAYAIGLKDTFLSSAGLTVSTTTNSATVSSGGTTVTCTADSGKKITSGGGFVNYGANAGQMLTSSFPASSTTWTVTSRDSITADSASTLTTYCIGISSP